MDSAKKILRERVVAAFAWWMYDAGLPFNCVNYIESLDESIEVLGQYGLGMKPSTYHKEFLIKTKAVEKTKIILEPPHPNGPCSARSGFNRGTNVGSGHQVGNQSRIVGLSRKTSSDVILGLPHPFLP